MTEDGKRCIFNIPNQFNDVSGRFIDTSKLKNPIELFL
jgi:hypothetical protein